MKLPSIKLYSYLSLLFAVQFLSAGAQTDTLNAHLQSGTSASMMNTVQVLPEGGMVQPLSAGPPVISYGAARTFGVNEQVDWSPTNSGDAATFSVTVEQTLASGYYNPLNTVSGADGSLYIANTGYHSIFKRTSAGVQTVFAGGNSTSYGYVNGTGTAARFRHPSFVAVDASGNIFVSDQQNHRIRKITPSGVVTVFAGSGSIGSANGTGTAASFQYPMGLAFDGAGNLYVADAYNHRIRKITPAGVVSTYAGSGTAGLQNGALLTARFNYPMGLSFDSNGDLYVADRTNHAVRRISSGQVTTIAGNGTAGNVDGQGSTARINNANNLVVDNGSIYLVDMMNNSLRYISPSGYVTTISTGGQFTNPFGISRTPDGKYHITENTSNRIKKVNIQAAYSISPALPSGLTFDRSTGKISGKLSAATASQSYTVTARNSSGTATSILTFSVGGSSGGTNFGSSDQNYILETVPRRAYKSVEAMSGKPVDSVSRSIQYFDGLGRPMQSLQWQASPAKKDIIQHIEYDGFGRESKKYLPYAASSLHTGNNDISYKAAAKTHQTAYYATTGSWDSHVKKTAQPYSQTVFENSPLNRVLEQGAPGQAWQPAADRGTVTTASSTGHTVAMEYGTNVAGDVRLWTINANNLGASGTPYYAAGKLYRTVTKDENWVTANGKGGTVEEYKDFEDRVVLKRVWKSNTEALNTYYVYDDFGDLRYVIPPGYTTFTVTDNSTDFNEQVYAYRYDGRRRLVEKKVPGKYWEYIVYNRNDQPILTQDSVQRAAKKWSYTKYDAFGRIASTGIYTNVNPATRKQVQAWADLKVPQWEDRIGTANYTLKSFPDTLARLQELTVSYYDDYTFANAATLPEQGITKSLKIKTLLTGMKVSKDDGTAPLLTVNYYDDRAQLIQSVSQNHLNGTDRVTNEYSFVGELTKSTRVHMAKGVTTTVVTTNSYDHVGRLTASKHYINDPLKEVTLAKNEYNEIGQLKKKSVGGDKAGANYHTAVDYAYNERGWATGASSPQFTYQLNYNVNSAGTTLGNAQYNGNIAQQLWGHGAATNSTFSYAYDRLNRLTNGTSTGTTVMIEALTYDDMGNIRTLARNTGNTTATTSTTYTYNNSNKSNRLASLSGNANSYLYDANGNATRDRTGMTVRYNHLSLPDSVYNASVRVGYLYDAMGAKLRKYSNQGGNRDYVGGIEYNGNNIELIHMGEGVAYRNTSTNTYTYRYNLTDHLGNVRSTVYRNPANNNAVEVLQKDDYYPFGKQRVVAAGNNKYLYNGKEIQGELGGQYDYGARFYDAEIGRWNVVDPMAEHPNQVDKSPYSAFWNNPIVYDDPDGQCPFCPWLDAVVDVGFVLYDVGVLVHEKVTTGSTSGANWAALGADGASILVPMSVGAGAAVRAGVKAINKADNAVDAVKTTSKVVENAKQGKQFEGVVTDNLKKTGHKNVAEQVTIKAENGVKTRVDVASKDPSGKVKLTEAKSSQTAPLTKNQKSAFPSIEEKGGTVVGKGKPGFEGGTKIPPTKVDIVRPKKEINQ
ncbi:hypothetical protein FAZ19_07265 [Sphingobacterium alkalisoli]|uniref:DUF6443 domain-containing protein n=1 Tax=Sphingobacterium alkalisoli TaxID=1874115 RepID=A0A4U0H4V0_9SPHI|nr:DUF6443 domain-containing protein [Sphingobacterium alkalisoli]TJY66710.1 hypothetical protein FAZ19_07265 [Sphingobacterium alkalisoli]GGH14670.1 hypothetical protein GCM10011418_15780 [Sphingobacterium alkalisoli]